MRASLLLMMLGAAACMTAGAGTVVLTSNVNYRSPPVTYTVGQNHVSSTNLDATLDAKGCVRGTVAGEPLDLCMIKTASDGTQRWEGTTGEVTIKPVDNGKNFEVAGFIYVNGQRQFDVSQTLRAQTQEGAAWDQLRAQPVLLLIATTATDLHAMRGHRRRL
jgi:hypothetical protein